MGYCKIEKIIMVKNAWAVVMVLPSYINVKKVNETMVGGHSQYIKIVAT
jgi:hypothetical protein